ncbi:MAG TPA: ATP-binding protein [Burkholderiaceae bacterium]|jgi:signal transduction histidine kinase|uniref:sensor histidine kinase n=1 Tax=Candidatus Skiveiella danica TaxID=3386177 RepID=UPI0009C6E5C1|nr:MAG: Sensor protein FixL [Alphaproteobacteria bacterium ADurb.Bin100]HOF30276.1 ATP-binding protein [Burkholderiaceae bacterium]HOS85760.1 ATP-binding protein [Burkholderiaceae bacterium]HPL78067.1 ATP-binding protein [Burkholderiaceae bacterium]
MSTARPPEGAHTAAPQGEVRPASASPATPAQAPTRGLRHWLTSSVTRRLLAGLLIALATSGVVLTALALSMGQRSLRSEQEVAAKRLATVFEASLHNAMLRRDLAGLGHILEALGQAPGVARARLLDVRGQVRFASDPALLDEHPSGALEGLCLQAGCKLPGPRYDWTETPDGAALRVAYPIANQARCIQCHRSPAERPVNGVLLVDLEPLPAGTGLHTHSALLVLGLAALALFGGMTAWTLRRQINQPLQQLTAAADRIACGDISARAAMSGNDEFARLGRHFDAMAERIDATVGSLRAQQGFLQQLVDAIPDPVLVVGPDYRIRIANAAYGQLIGQAHADIVQACCHQMGRGQTEPCPPTLVSCPVAELRNSPHTLRTVMSLRHRDGSEIPVEIEAAPLSAGGEWLTVEVLRPLERSIRFSQEQRLATIGLLANGVAHEIHNPLASIRLALQASLRGLNAKNISHEELVEYLELVDDQIDRAVLATDRLMQMSHPPGDNPEPVSLAAAIDDVLALLGEECRQRGVTASVDVKPPGGLVLGDRAELRQVFVNLVHNALHAMPQGGRIHIAAEPLDDQHLRVTVSDTGTGIAPADLPRIFLPFFSRRADGQHGMGLGLSICKSLVEHFGGQISVSSQAGQGTTFTLRLRKAESAADTPSGNSPEPQPAQPPAPPP